jgi:S1-C subfamily serine protease
MKPFETRLERSAPVVLGVLFGLCIALLIVAIIMFRRVEERGYSPRPGGGQSGSQSVAQDRANAIVEATRRASPAVVSVTALRTKDVTSDPYLYFQWLQQYYFNPSFQDQFGDRPVLNYTIIGSGLVVSPDGYILTNEHVVRDAERILVTMNDGAQAEGSVVGMAADYDLALLKIEAKNLPYAPFGDSDRLSIGEWVIAIGNPFGYLLNDTQPTVTVGVVSALHRDIKSNSRVPIFQNMIQTDAAINPGNSGGPLVSSAGEVIGINTFIFSTEQGSNLGMGFAIPINTSKMVMDELLHYGRVRVTWTGISLSELTPEESRRLGLGAGSGLLVASVKPGGPGAEAGIKEGDVILEVNGSKLRTFEQARRALFGLRVGDETDAVMYRGRKQFTVKLRLAEMPKGT